MRVIGMHDRVTESQLAAIDCRRGTARRAMAVEILSTAALLFNKSHLKRLQWVYDLKLDSTSSEMERFHGSLWYEVSISLSCIDSEILPLLQRYHISSA